MSAESNGKGSERRSSRVTKAKALFSPDNSHEHKRARLMVQKPDIPTEPRNKWDQYQISLKRLLLKLSSEEHRLNTITQSRWGSSGTQNHLEAEEAQCRQKLESVKHEIETLMKNLSEENKTDRQFGSQYEDTEAGGEIDVMTIVCSHCGSGESTDSNDIVFCDREGCDRCYHMKCLDPEVLPEELGEDFDWFCRRCSCASSCLMLLEEYGFSFLDESSVDFAGIETNFALAAVDDDDDDDDDDDLPAEPLAGLRSMLHKLDHDLEYDAEPRGKKRKKKAKAKVKEAKDDVLSADNIIPSEGYCLRRRKVQVDYVTMNAMFDKEDDDDDGEYKS